MSTLLDVMSLAAAQAATKPAGPSPNSVEGVLAAIKEEGLNAIVFHLGTFNFTLLYTIIIAVVGFILLCLILHAIFPSRKGKAKRKAKKARKHAIKDAKKELKAAKKANKNATPENKADAILQESAAQDKLKQLKKSKKKDFINPDDLLSKKQRKLKQQAEMNAALNAAQAPVPAAPVVPEMPAAPVIPAAPEMPAAPVESVEEYQEPAEDGAFEEVVEEAPVEEVVEEVVEEAPIEEEVVEEVIEEEPVEEVVEEVEETPIEEEVIEEVVEEEPVEEAVEEPTPVVPVPAPKPVAPAPKPAAPAPKPATPAGKKLSPRKQGVVAVTVPSKEEREAARKAERRAAPRKAVAEPKVPQKYIVISGDAKDSFGKYYITMNGSATRPYRFVLKANNGQILFESEPYKVKPKLASINAFKKHCASGNFEVDEDKAGNFRYKLYSKTDMLIGVGESYTTKAACEKSIESVKNFAESATVIEDTTIEE